MKKSLLKQVALPTAILGSALAIIIETMAAYPSKKALDETINSVKAQCDSCERFLDKGEYVDAYVHSGRALTKLYDWRKDWEKDYIHGLPSRLINLVYGNPISKLDERSSVLFNKVQEDNEKRTRKERTLRFLKYLNKTLKLLGLIKHYEA